MQRLFDNVKAQIADFAEQRDDLILIVSCTDDDAALLLKLHQDLEQNNQSDVFLLFSDNFVQAGPYVSVLAERLREQRRIACEALRDENKPPLPAIPEPVFDDRQHPSCRLYAAISYARSLLPPQGGHRLIWTLDPQHIADRRAYLELLAPFLPKKGIQPWMRGLRLVARDLPATAQFAPALAQTPRVRLRDFDAGPAAIEKSLDEETKDESLPVEQRMQSLLQLALLDAAHGRNPAAFDKYQVLLGHFQATKNNAMQALVLNGVGDVYHRAGDLDNARHWYECAVPLAGEAKDGVILSTIVKNLAIVAWSKSEYAVAAQYFDGLDKLAAHLLSPEAKVDAQLWLGLCHERMTAMPQAVGSWEGAATLAKTIGLPQLEVSALTHLDRGYRTLGLHEKVAQVRHQLAVLEAGGGA